MPSRCFCTVDSSVIGHSGLSRAFNFHIRGRVQHKYIYIPFTLHTIERNVSARTLHYLHLYITYKQCSCTYSRVLCTVQNSAISVRTLEGKNAFRVQGTRCTRNKRQPFVLIKIAFSSALRCPIIKFKIYSLHFYTVVRSAVDARYGPHTYTYSSVVRPSIISNTKTTLRCSSFSFFFFFIF
jgi:hypothetical protein